MANLDSSYEEEERVFDFGDEEDVPSAPSKQYPNYGGEDFSSYLRDDEAIGEESIQTFQQLQHSPDTNYHDSLPQPPCQDENDYYDIIPQMDSSQGTSSHPHEGAAVVRKSAKSHKLSHKLKKHIERATLRFSKNPSSLSLSTKASNNNTMHNYSFADCKMGLSLAAGDASDSGIGLESTENSHPGLSRDSWWSIGTLSNKPSPSSTISSKPSPTSTISKQIINSKQRKPSIKQPSSFNNTVSSVFKKVTGTLKNKNAFNKQHDVNNIPQHNNTPHLQHFHDLKL